MSDKDLGCLVQGLLYLLVYSGPFSLWYNDGIWQPFALVLLLTVVWIYRRPLGRFLGRALRRSASTLWRRIRKKPNLTAINLDVIKWDEFEHLIGRVFEARGFKVQYTRHSTDQGIDVIAQSKKQRVGVQAKRYRGSVGNDAVMAAIAGSKFYDCNRTVVVCTSSFTRAAVELADTTGVELWDRTRLESEIRWL